MKIGDLRQLIKDMEDEDSISFTIADGCCNDWIDLEFEWTPEADEFPDDSKLLRFHFKPLPGYFSCMQAGATRKAHDAYRANLPQNRKK